MRLSLALSERRYLFVILASLIAISIWPMGSNRFLFVNCLAIAVGALLTAVAPYGIGPLAARMEKVRWLAPAGLGAAAVLAWVFMQALVDVPAFLAHPVWAMASSAGSESYGSRIALDAGRAVFEATKLLLSAGCFILAAMLCSRRRNASFFVSALGTVATAYAAYALGRFWFGWEHTWLTGHEGPFPVNPERASGSFVSANHFAVIPVLGLLIALGVLFRRSGEIVLDRGTGLAISSLLTYAMSRNPVWIAAMIVNLSAISATASKGALGSAFAGVITLVLIYSTRSRRRTIWSWAFIAVFAVGAMVFVFAGPAADRLAYFILEGDPLRLQLWRTAWSGILTSPYTGSGLGAFQTYFDLSARLETAQSVDYAHNDWLEFAFSAGLPAAMVWWFVLLSIFLLILSASRSRNRDRDRDTCAIAAAFAIFVAVHSAFDSALSIPAISMMFGSVLGAGLGCALGRAPTIDSSGKQGRLAVEV